MAYRDFQHFLEVLASKGELKAITEPISPYLEITEIADRVMKKDGPALLFNNVVGPAHRTGTPNHMSAVMNHPSIHPASAPTGSMKYDYPVAINTMGSEKRMSMALSCDHFDDHAQRLVKLLGAPGNMPKTIGEKLKMAFELGGEVKTVGPKIVTNAACQEIVMMGDDIDLTKFPILTCWPEDGGPYVTLPLVFTHDPETGKRNVGMYRVQLYDKNTCGMHWQMHKTGMRQMEDAGEMGKKKFEVAVVLGGDPVYAFSAISPLPPGIDEMLFAGFLRRENVKTVKCKTIDVQVPADAEIVIEGYVDPAERRLEGPFGDHTGYYSLAGDFPVLHVTAVTMRPKPVWPATIVGVPPMEDGWMGKAVERIFMPLIQLTVPEIIDMNLPVDACFHNIAFVSIKKKYPGHAYKVMNAIWGLGQLAFTKMVFIFDEDTNVQDFGEVLFRLGANCDPGRDVLHSRGPIDQLDHAAQIEGFGGKIGFDCTHKWPGENGYNRNFPKLIRMSDDVKTRVDGIWDKLGL
jgi:4-hydroxy-3-polyprenylbenzoate decarboxylase